MKRLCLNRVLLILFCLITIFFISSAHLSHAGINPPPTVSMPVSALGIPGQTEVSVPINVTDATGITKVDITLTFSSSILTATHVQLTDLTSGFTLATPMITSGQVIISMNQGTAIPSGSGAILNVIFNVSSSATPGTYTPLTLQSVSLLNQNNQSILCLKVPGLFTVIPTNDPNLSNLPPSPPINVSPLNGETVLNLTPNLEASPFWDANSEDTHASSWWQVDDNPDFSSPEYDSQETTVDKTSVILPPGKLSHSMTYYWRVRYKDGQNEWSPWSSYTSFIPQIPPETWSGQVSFSLKFSVYTEDSSGNEKFASETVPFTGTLKIYWVNELKNLVPDENGCYIYFEGSSDYGPVSFCITQKASMLTYYVKPSTSDTAYLKGTGTFTGKYDEEDLAGPIFIDVTKATFKKDKAGTLVSISFSSKLGGGMDDATVFSGSLNGTLTKSP